MNELDFKRKTKRLALMVIEIVDELPNRISARAIRHQLIRSGTSVGSNYRAACRSRSRPDMISKLGIVEEEADQTLFWFEILGESGIISAERLCEAYGEANEILSMTVASKKTLRSITAPNSSLQNRKSEIENRKSK